MIEVKGDVWDLFDPTTMALAHGCNARGVMGAGFAKQVRDRYPECYRSYNLACATRPDIELGHVLPWAGDGTVIYNLITQIEPGPNGDLAAISRAMLVALDDASFRSIGTIICPRIGAGIASLPWEHVRRALTLAEAHYPEVGIIAVSL